MTKSNMPTGLPTRGISPANAKALRKTAAPASSASAFKPATEEPVQQVDFRSNLKKNRATVAPGTVSGVTKDSALHASDPIESKPANSSPFGPRIKKSNTTDSSPAEPPPREAIPPRENKVKKPTTGLARKSPAKMPPSQPTQSTSTPTPVTVSSTSEIPSLPSKLGDYNTFTSFIESTINQINKERINGNASAAPQLNRANGNHFSFSMVTVDGVKYSTGDNTISFSLQEAVYPFLYAIALNEAPSMVSLIFLLNFLIYINPLHFFFFSTKR